VIIKCQKCGAENRLGQLFCRECGAKLDLNSMNPLKGHADGPGGGSGFGVARLVRVAISLILLAILGLLCWPAALPGDAPSGSGVQSVPVKMQALRGAILRNNEVVEEFSEADLNAHLNRALVSGAAAPGLLSLELKKVSVDIKPGTSAVVLSSTMFDLLPLTYSADVAVEWNGNGRFRFSPTRVAIGHLPLPGPLGQRIWRQISGLFGVLSEETALLQRLHNVQVEDGLVRVSTIADNQRKGPS
jgi:hypothetical protein